MFIVLFDSLLYKLMHLMAAPAAAAPAASVLDPTDFTTWAPDTWVLLDFDKIHFPKDPSVIICSLRSHMAIAMILTMIAARATSGARRALVPALHLTGRQLRFHRFHVRPKVAEKPQRRAAPPALSRRKEGSHTSPVKFYTIYGYYVNYSYYNILCKSYQLCILYFYCYYVYYVY